MTNLVERLYPLPDFRRTPWTLLRWWESRRMFYNRVVGATGVITVAGMLLILPERGEFLPGGLVMILVYGIMANVCYTFGWLTEVVARAVWGPKAPDMGPLFFREGLIFSVGLTLFPLFFTILWVIARTFIGLVI